MIGKANCWVGRVCPAIPGKELALVGLAVVVGVHSDSANRTFDAQSLLPV